MNSKTKSSEMFSILLGKLKVAIFTTQVFPVTRGEFCDGDAERKLK